MKFKGKNPEPDRQRNEVVYGVGAFVNNEFETDDPSVIEKLKSLGYEVIGEEEVKEVEEKKIDPKRHKVKK